MKKLFSLILALVILTQPCEASNKKMAFSHFVRGNTLTVVGVHPDGEGKDATILILPEGYDKVFTDIGIFYIDQITCGVNGSFMFNVGLADLSHYATIRVGGTGLDEATETRDFFSVASAVLSSVPDDSVRIGYDVYDLKSSHLTSSNIAESMKKGGNTLAYKWGGKWFDLMNPKAYSSAYLVPENAMDGEEVTAWKLEKWYVQGLSYPLWFE